MKPRLTIVLLLIVLGPLIVMGGLGARLARHEREEGERRTRQLLEARLLDIDARIGELLETRAREIGEGLDATFNPAPNQQILSAKQAPQQVVVPSPSEQLRELVRGSSTVEQAYLLAPDGLLRHPPVQGVMTNEEREFVQQTLDLWDSGALLAASREPSSLMSQEPANFVLTEDGWLPWFAGEGVRLVYWRHAPTGGVMGAVLDRSRLMADIIGVLPDSKPQEGVGVSGRTILRDANGDAIYEWGDYDALTLPEPDASITLSAPLSAWRLDYYAAPGSLGTNGNAGLLLSMIGGLIAAGAALLGLGVYFYRESARELRDASQRVSFVNQVSHELKTPLTNIRMYAEMLEDAADDEDDVSRRRVNVIVSESQRLSRLIGNVLSFGRGQRGALTVRKIERNVDEAIGDIVESFRPAMEACGVEIVVDANANVLAPIDADALEQIIGNLLSNVEKYAVDGGRVDIASRVEEDRVVIAVTDNGPGVAPENAGRVFEPFVRLSDKLTEGVSGAGLGLAIARDLAQLHGGDLRLLDSESGAQFELTLSTEG